MHRGNIWLWRKIKDSFFYKDSEYVHLWIHLLMTANYEDKETLFNGKAIRVKRGQLITGRHSLNEQTGIHESKIVRILKSLEIEQQIEQQKTNRFTVITIVNYEEYNGQQNGQPMNNKRTHLNTLKDIKSKRLSQSNCTVTKY